MKPSDLGEFLKSINARPKKGLSQNFLIDENVIQKVIDLSEIQPGDNVLEIGPGPGALTKALLDKGAKVFAVELDLQLAKALDRFQNGNLEIFPMDILKFPLERLPQNTKIVANLPYHITTPILEKVFASPFVNLTIIVQKEVAMRMKAKPHSKTFGSLSIFTQFYSKIHDFFVVKPGSFYPQPNVDSIVIRLDSKPLPDIDQECFFTLVHKAFQQRRKMITSTLGMDKELVRSALKEAGARTDARPENLSLNQWIMFVQKLHLHDL